MRIIIFVMIFLVAVPALAGNYRSHMAFCNQDKRCAQEQAKAKDLWSGQAWDGDLKSACREHISSSYNRNRDYVAAVNCVFGLQTTRNEQQALQAQKQRDYAEAERARAEARYYNRGGARIVIE